MSETNKIKILAIIPSGFCFGLQHVTIDFFSNFPSNVQSLFLLTRFGNGDMEMMLKKNNIPFSYSWLGMFSRKMDALNIKMSLHSLIKLPKLYYDYLKLKNKFKPDIIYFANHHELILLYPVLLLTKQKVVCHMHDPAPAIDFQKKTFSYYSKKVDHFIAISESVRKRTIELGCPPEKIKTIYNGIHITENISARTDVFIQNTGWPSDVCIIGITGQMTETKGAMDVVECFKELHSRNNKVRLVIGGKPIEPFKSQLKNKIEEFGLTNEVFFPGWLPEATDFFRNIDIFILASRHEEGFGLVIAEAMAEGKPVVSTNSGGAVEVIEDAKSGFIVARNNISQMTEKLFKLSVDPELRKQMGLAGRSRIEKHFNIEIQSKILMNHLLNIQN